MSDSNQASLLRANVPVVANALEVGARAIMKIAGNEISNRVGGQEVTPAFLQSALATRLRQRLLLNNTQSGS